MWSRPNFSARNRPLAISARIRRSDMSSSRAASFVVNILITQNIAERGIFYNYLLTNVPFAV